MNSNNLNHSDYFPIRDLSERTEVNTVTLRAWERRYGLLKPKRSSKGHRLYCEQDVATIEKVLALVARGVPISKVKPLLNDNAPLSVEQDDAENWSASISQLLTAVDSFSATKVEHLIQQMFSSYPIHACRQHLIDPVMAVIAQADDHGAAVGFMENEIVRYTLMRIGAKVGKKKNAQAVVLIAGNQAPMWRLALMALELTDKDIPVYLFSRPFNVTATVNIAEKFDGSATVFYQDGVLNQQDSKQLADATRDNERLLLCGTAPMLSKFDDKCRVYEDLNSCMKDFQAKSLKKAISGGDS